MQMSSTPVHFVVSMLKGAEDYRTCYAAHEQAVETLATIPYVSPPRRSIAWERADAERAIALCNLAAAQATLLRIVREGQ